MNTQGISEGESRRAALPLALPNMANVSIVSRCSNESLFRAILDTLSGKTAYFQHSAMSKLEIVQGKGDRVGTLYRLETPFAPISFRLVKMEYGSRIVLKGEDQQLIGWQEFLIQEQDLSHTILSSHTQFDFLGYNLGNASRVLNPSAVAGTLLLEFLTQIDNVASQMDFLRRRDEMIRI